MEKSKPVDAYNVYLYCDKCGGLMNETTSLSGVGTHSFGYSYRCEQCGDTVTSFLKYPHVRYEERK